MAGLRVAGSMVVGTEGLYMAGLHVAGSKGSHNNQGSELRCFLFDSLLSCRVEDLKMEELKLQEHIVLLRREKAQLEQGDSQFEEIRKKEVELAEVRTYILQYIMVFLAGACMSCVLAEVRRYLWSSTS